MYRWMWGAALTAVAITMSSCSTVPGTPQAQPSAAPTSTPVAVDPVREGALAEGVRLADVTAHPNDIDPDLTIPGSSGPLTRPFLLVNVGHNPAITAAAVDNGMLAGYLTYHSASGAHPRKGLTQGVIRFPDAVTATRAADDLAEAALTTKGMLEVDNREAVPLAEATETRFSRVRQTSFYASMAFTPYREYVIYSAVNAVDTATTEAVTVRAAELQRPLLDSFVATDPAKYAGLSRDPSGVLALATGSGGAATGAYGPAGAALLVYDPRRLRSVFTDVGMDVMGVGDANVFRTRDGAGAITLAGALGIAAVTSYALGDAKLSPAASPDVPDTTCWSATSAATSRWFCILVRGRYVAEIWEKTENEAFEIARTQYRVLEGAR
ncbi:DUF7373 family lipoprotein [Nocardia arizonensis]|uniref:DUF7373 family lipoprotein n=1 Tax=Nocardia arizonensis TaxID=1141647 RepID=UPI0006D1D546|nr:hypothetical protein [Nocardia arizonensis]